jgi:hypothetical protein
MPGCQHQYTNNANRKEETTLPWSQGCKKSEIKVAFEHGFGTRGGVEPDRPDLKQTASAGVRTLKISDLIAGHVTDRRVQRPAATVHSDNTIEKFLLASPRSGRCFAYLCAGS